MARKTNARTVVNRKALDAITAGFVDAFDEIGQTVIARTHPPDDDPHGYGLVTEGDYGVWANGRKVAGGATKPRGVSTKTGVTLVAGFPFPARFNELGTIRQPARPFFTPVVVGVIPGFEGFIKPAVQKKLASVR